MQPTSDIKDGDDDELDKDAEIHIPLEGLLNE